MSTGTGEERQWMSVHECPGKRCDYEHARAGGIRTHLRERHCAFCGKKEGVKYIRADHLGYRKPGVKELFKRIYEDVYATLTNKSQPDWEAHEGGVQHTLMSERDESPPRTNCWHAIIVCHECRPKYRRIIAGASIVARWFQPYRASMIS